jgi:hypothetical protein
VALFPITLFYQNFARIKVISESYSEMNAMTNLSSLWLSRRWG